ncbi:MAG: hypothetical protein LQ351_007886 [Letrouitia transgressa]|nr:MAG: hypothetical protein LQ351_007886 [Letrouitia transgressa]
MAGDRPFPAQSPSTSNNSTVTNCLELSEHSVNLLDIKNRDAPFLFLKLPLELRRQVYHEYLEAQLTAQDELIYEKSLFEELQGLVLLQVNRQARLELKQLLARDKMIRVRISWQGWNFHPLSVLCKILRSAASKINLKRATCIQVNVYAPHNKRLTDLVRIWRYAGEFCDKLREFPKVKRLRVFFMECGDDQALSDNDRKEAAWSSSRLGNSGPAKRTLEKYEHLYFDKIDPTEWWTDIYNSTDNEANSDLKYILDQFSTVTNVKDVYIELPLSLRNNSRLHEMAQTTANIMCMRRPSIDPEKYRDRMGKMFSQCSPDLLQDTGRNSKQRLKELDKRLEGLNEREMYLFQEIWPHLCCFRKLPQWRRKVDWESWSDNLYPLWPCTLCQDVEDFRFYQHRDLCLDTISRLCNATGHSEIIYTLKRLAPRFPIWKSELLQLGAVSPVGDEDHDKWQELRDRTKPRWPHRNDLSDISHRCRKLLRKIQ